jgi:Lactonase, 7-bladed beta-propeller
MASKGGFPGWRWAVVPVLTLAVAVAAPVSAGRAASSVYVTNSGESSLSQFEAGPGGALSALAPARVASAPGPQWVAVSSDGRNVYVPNLSANSVSQFDAGAGGGLSPKAPATIAAGSNPSGIAISPDGRSVYVGNYGGGTLSQFDVGAGGRLSPKTPATVATGQKPAGVVVSPDGRNRLGTGEKLAVRLPAGRYRLRLVARDRVGRTGVASRTVRVRPEPLRITRISYKPRVSRRTRKVVVTIRTSAPATLRARGHRFRIGTRARFVLPLPRRPATGVLRIPVTLAASGGRRLTGTIQLRRR